MVGPATVKTAACTGQGSVLDVVKRFALRDHPDADLNRQIVDRIPARAKFVLIGEATHGTKEFYDQRAQITRMLIEERGFQAVCAEADFPDAFRVNLYVRGLSQDGSALEALSEFKRFPQWMWRNQSVEGFVEWLRAYNQHRRAAGQHGGVGFYGLDVYSLHHSADAVIEFLEGVDAEAAKKARSRYHCFDKYGADAQAYGMAVGAFGRPSCENPVLAQLLEIRKKVPGYLQQIDSGVWGEEAALQVVVNAMVVKGAEAYYRNMFFREERTWNLRDQHFMDVLKTVAKHVDVPDSPEAPGGVVVWAHNSHLGDARATDMSWRRGEINLGQLAREQLPDGTVYNIGFSTHTGTVSAASDWGEPRETKRVVPSLAASWEALLHSAQMPHFALDLRQQDVHSALQGTRLERAIGVIYRPETERYSHYFDAKLPHQFDLVVHVDKTTAVEPLPPVVSPISKRINAGAAVAESPLGALTDEEGDLPETFPQGV